MENSNIKIKCTPENKKHLLDIGRSFTEIGKFLYIDLYPSEYGYDMTRKQILENIGIYSKVKK